jgi:hypothetical protein
VDVGLGLTFNTVLEIGSVSTVVEVGSGAGSELQTLNSTVSSVISGQSLMLLPNTGRDAATFAILQPATQAFIGGWALVRKRSEPAPTLIVAIVLRQWRRANHEPAVFPVGAPQPDIDLLHHTRLPGEISGLDEAA